MKTKFRFLTVLSLFIWAGTYAQQPVAHWTFDDKNASDTSGYNFDGSVYNIHFLPGMNCDSAAWFNGDDSYVQFGDVLDTLFTGGTFSISLWAYPEAIRDSEGRRSFLISKWFSGGYSSNAFILSTYNFHGANKQIGFSPLPINTWSHVVVSVNNGDTKIYINGDLVAQEEGLNFNATSTSLRLGSHRNNEYRFKGGIDDVRFYATSLTDSMVNSIMQENAFYNQYTADIESLTDTEIKMGPEARSGLEYEWNTGALESQIMVSSTISDTSTYSLSITSSENCTITDTMNVIWHKTEDVLVSRWDFNDSTALANSNAVINQAKTDTGIMCSQAFDFNGTDTYISFGDTLDDLFADNDFSISLWAYIRDTTEKDQRYYSMLISKWNTSSANDNAFILYVNAFYFGNQVATFSFDIPELNKWHHFTITKKGSLTKLYIDKELVGETFSGKINHTTKPLMIAAHNNNHYNLDGKIDEIKIFNIAVSERIIEDLYNQSSVQPLGVLEDKTVLENETLTLDAGAGYEWYHWHDGSNQQMYTFENVTSDQIVSVLVLDDKGCYADTVSITVEEDNTSFLSGENYTQGIKAWPMPARNEINVLFQEQVPYYVEVINLQGKLVFAKKNKSKTLKIPFNNHEGGIYLLRFYFEDHSSSTIKILKH